MIYDWDCYYEGLLPGSSRGVDSVASMVSAGPGIGPLSQASVSWREPSTTTTNIKKVNRKCLFSAPQIVVGDGVPR